MDRPNLGLPTVRPIDLGLPPLPTRPAVATPVPPGIVNEPRTQPNLPTLIPIPQVQRAIPTMPALPTLTPLPQEQRTVPIMPAIPTIPAIPVLPAVTIPAMPALPPLVPPEQRRLPTLPPMPTQVGQQPIIPPLPQIVALPPVGPVGLPPAGPVGLPPVGPVGLPPIGLPPVGQATLPPVGQVNRQPVITRVTQRGVFPAGQLPPDPVEGPRLVDLLAAAQPAAQPIQPRLVAADLPPILIGETEQQRAQRRYQERIGNPDREPRNQGRNQQRNQADTLNNVGNIVEHLHDNFNRLDLGDPEMITELRAIKSDIIPLPNYSAMMGNPRSSLLLQVMEYPQEQIARIIQPVFGLFHGTKDETVSLFWWGIIFRNIMTSTFNRYTGGASDKINALTNEQLNAIVPDDWPYPRDRASVIFKLLTGYNPPRADATKEPRYQAIAATPANLIGKLAKYVYNYFGPIENGYYENPSIYSPYRHVALQTPSILEGFVLNFVPQQVEAFANRMGMTIPDHIEDKERYYFNNLKFYDKVLLRNPERLFPVPDLTNLPEEVIPQLLSVYTDKELLDGYELENIFLEFVYSSRKELIRKIAENRARTNNLWYFRNKNCINSNRNNLFELAPRVNTPEDPLISYGTLQNYRCWNRDELEATWVEQNGVFKFAVPDYRQGDPFDSFPIPSIQQLRNLLEPIGPPFVGLIGQINQGLILASNATAKVRELKRQYDGLSNEQKEIVKRYLVWMFASSMFMRFWKGPGNPYPIIWNDPKTEKCTGDQRSVHITAQFQLRDQILAAADPQLRNWLLELPRIEYDFKNKTAYLGAEVINFVLDKVRKGDFCLAAASDKLVQTSYYLATQILELNNNGFNQLVNGYLGNNSPFDPMGVTRTGHEDPVNILQRLE